MSVDDSRTGDAHWYWIHAALSTLVPFWVVPQLPQPLPVPGLELAGVVASLTRSGFSHDALPLVVIVAAEPNSAVTALAVRVTATLASVRCSPSSATSLNT